MKRTGGVLLNTKKIAAVVLNGRLLDRAALDKLLADAKEQAGAR